jgi:monofunctional biosynthetic peptidoglycan transglycosylase
VERQYPTLGNPAPGPAPSKEGTDLRVPFSRLRRFGKRRVPLHDDDEYAVRKRRMPRIALWILVGALALTVVPVLILAVVPAWTSSFMVGYQVERLTSDKALPALEHDWVGWDAIAPAAKLAVIAAEDQRFAEHFGFDFEAIGKAVQHNRDHRRKRGASTISQQVAKNLFLWSGRSWTRKAFEVGYTVLIELLWSKKRVLEMYLNCAEFGPGVYGVEAASQKYFRKPASKLTYPEAALLAAVLPNPKRLRVGAPSTYVQQRAGWILGQMYHLGPAVIDQL